MARHLRDSDVWAIVSVIRAWPGKKITWEAVCDAVQKQLRGRPARQTLNARAEIRAAYLSRKNGLKQGHVMLPSPSSLSAASRRIAEQQALIDELNGEKRALLEQFVRWQYNAYKHGLTEAQLNADLPQIDRDRTEAKATPAHERASDRINRG